MFQTTFKPVTLFTSADSGAPVLTGAAGSLRTLLEACLVTGYGDKQALGWEMPYQTATAAVFRSREPDSNRRYLKVDNSKANHASIRAYTQMTGLDDGTGEFGYRNGYERFGYFTDYYNHTPQAEWWLVGHGAAFALVVNTSSYSSNNMRDDSCLFYFGDFPSIVPGDTGNTVYLHSGGSSTSYGNNSFDFVTYNGSNGPLFAKSWDGVRIRAGGELHSLGAKESVPYPDPISGGLTAAEIYLHEVVDGKSLLRGLLPGLYCCANNLSSFKNGDVIPLDGSDEVWLKFGSSSRHYLLNASRWEA